MSTDWEDGEPAVGDIVKYRDHPDEYEIMARTIDDRLFIRIQKIVYEHELTLIRRAE